MPINLPYRKSLLKNENFNINYCATKKKNVLKAYHAWGKKKLYGREYDGIKRISYLIDEEGMIIKVYEKVKTKTHAQDILKDIGELD